MSKVLLINGSPNEYGCTYTALQEIIDTLHGLDVGTELVWLGKRPIAGCIACNTCHTSEDGQCIVHDMVNELDNRLDEFQGIIVGAPVYYAGPAGQITAFLDRFFYRNPTRFAGKLGASVVSCRRGGASASFDRLNKYFTVTNMPLVTSQYWNQVHGFTPEDVKKDVEGLQTMRTLARNMAWLLKCIEAGDAAGVQRPYYEEEIRTNFIGE